MNQSEHNRPILHPPLRLWPGVVIVLLQLIARFLAPVVAPGLAEIGVMVWMLGTVAVLVWWAFFSRIPPVERWGGIVLAVVALWVTYRLLHVSVAEGAMGMLFGIYAVPALGIALVLWAVFARNLGGRLRKATLVATILVVSFGWTLVRTGGFTGAVDSDFAWRWSETPEERLVAHAGELPSAGAGDVRLAGSPEWPGFRGPERNGVVAGTRIGTDWSATPPTELWRRPVGPGWSSFAVHGDLVYTQEQRGDEEVVSCYRASTGEPVWHHGDPVRFWESNAGAGPRGTPALAGGLVYSLGGTGVVNALDARTGEMVWSRNAAEDTGAELPEWGFSGSPLVVGDAVVVAASGTLIAYQRDTGETLWRGSGGGEGYSSPQLVGVNGTQHLVQLSGDGALGVDPADGSRLWAHEWSGFPIVQPAVTRDGDLLLAVDADSGLRRLAVTRDAGAGAGAEEGWSAEELWTSRGLKPYFNDFVVHGDHAYGFDGRILACMELASGERCWKGGRYGNGQLVLLRDQDLLLVLSEDGELALVEAQPDGYRELTRRPAIEGKTWNHPVVADDLLLVRNGQEMAAFRLPPAGP